MNEVSTIKKAKKGDVKSIEKILSDNMGLVVKIAKHYYTSTNDNEDLLQEGRIGLLDAIKDFDFKYKTQFSTFAYYKIKKRINKFVSRTCGYGAGNYKKLVTKKEQFKLIESDLQRPLTLEEKAKIYGKSLIDFISLFPTQCSFDETFIHTNDYLKVVNNLDKQLDLKKAFSVLDKDEIELLSLYFGLNGQESHTFKQLEDYYDLGDEMIRINLHKILAKIRENFGVDKPLDKKFKIRYTI